MNTADKREQPDAADQTVEKIKIKVMNKSGMPLPSYVSPEAAGMDVHACLEEDVVIGPMQRVLIPTGLYLETPPGYECQIRPRSGLALHHGITVLNTPGTVDADSRADIGVLLINLSNDPFIVHPGDRICQMLFKKCERVEWEEVEALEHTWRGTRSFGASGI